MGIIGVVLYFVETISTWMTLFRNPSAGLIVPRRNHGSWPVPHRLNGSGRLVKNSYFARSKTPKTTGRTTGTNTHL